MLFRLAFQPLRANIGVNRHSCGWIFGVMPFLWVDLWDANLYVYHSLAWIFVEFSNQLVLGLVSMYILKKVVELFSQELKEFNTT